MTIDLNSTFVEHELVSQLVAAPYLLRRVLVTERLTVEHLIDPGCRSVLAALGKINDRGETPTETLILAELGRDPRVENPAEILEAVGFDLYGTDPAALCREIMDLHRRRQLRRASTLIYEAAVELDSALRMAEAERLLTQPEAGTQTSWAPTELASWYFDHLDAGTVEAWPYEFARMNEWTVGGMRRGEYTLLGGWSAHGKSILLDQMLDHFASQDLKVHLYINEHTRGARLDRMISRLSGVPYRRVRSRELEPTHRRKIVEALDGGIKVGMTDCAGWTADEISRHIRWNRWDIAGVDILHQIAHQDERGMAQISQAMRSTALSTGTSVLATVHLNDGRVMGTKHPAPVARDIRMSGMLFRDADNVLFIHRDENDDGLPENTGILMAAKLRDGQPNVMKVLFDPGHMRFESATGLSVVREDRQVPDPDSRIESNAGMAY